MKNIILSILAVLASMPAVAQSVNQEKAIQEISNAAAGITTMQCSFVQTKTLKMLGDKMVSKGVLYCKQPDMLRWEYTSPYTYTFILNGGKVSITKGSKSDVIDVNQNKMFKEIARIMMNSVLGKCLTDKNSFKTSVTGSGQTYIATLVPLKRELKQMFTKIELYYDRQAKVVNKVKLYERNGDFTDIELINIKKNVSINASLFKIG